MLVKNVPGFMTSLLSKALKFFSEHFKSCAETDFRDIVTKGLSDAECSLYMFGMNHGRVYDNPYSMFDLIKLGKNRGTKEMQYQLAVCVEGRLSLLDTENIPDMYLVRSHEGGVIEYVNITNPHFISNVKDFFIAYGWILGTIMRLESRIGSDNKVKGEVLVGKNAYRNVRCRKRVDLRNSSVNIPIILSMVIKEIASIPAYSQGYRDSVYSNIYPDVMENCDEFFLIDNLEKTELGISNWGDTKSISASALVENSIDEEGTRFIARLVNGSVRLYTILYASGSTLFAFELPNKLFGISNFKALISDPIITMNADLEKHVLNLESE